MKKLLVNFIRDEEGASAAEYAILLGVIGALLAAAATALSGAISGAINGAATVINSNPVQ